MKARSHRGFTLIELLVVIAIVSLLSSVVLAMISSSRVKARDAQRIANARQIGIALDQYELTNGTYKVASAGYNDGGSGYVAKVGVSGYNTAIIAALKSNSVYSSNVLQDPLYGTDNYYLGLCTSTNAYTVFLKVEQPILQQASSTVQKACDGVTADANGFNYIAYANGGSMAWGVGGGGSGGGTGCASSWNGAQYIPASSCTSGGVVGTTTTYAASYPIGIAFDGTNMWTANYSGNSVSKISPSGTVTTYTGTGAAPTAIAYDGANMWTANRTVNSVSKITSSGVITTYAGLGSNPHSIAFDGTNMWTANEYGSVTKITPAGVMTTYSGAGGNIQQGIAFDGTNMWTANYNDNSVTKITPAGVMTTYKSTGLNPYAIAFDGVNMWTANYNSNSVTKVSPSGVMTSYSGTGAYPMAIAFDGTNMWTANSNAHSVTRITPAGVMTTYTTVGIDPESLAFDGVNMWSANYSGTTVSKIVVR